MSIFARSRRTPEGQFLSNTHAFSPPAKDETNYNSGMRDRAKVGIIIGASELDT
jgi:hypothetical protein